MSDHITLQEAAIRAGVKYNTLRAWLVEGLFTLTESDKPGRTHRPHLIAPQTAARLYLAADLIRAGVETRTAWRIALGDVEALYRLREAVGADGAH